MQYRRLGKSGLEVSEVGLGTNNFGSRMEYAAAAAVIDHAIDLGVTLIDTADVYSNGVSEQMIGRALRGKRDKALVATKFAGPIAEGPHGAGGSRMRVMQGVEDSLRRLDTDYIDLYQMHRPDPATPIEETLRALDDLVRQGKVRYIGCSNFEAWQIVEAAWTSDASGIARFTSAQPEYSLVNRQIEAQVLPVCGRYGLGILPYFPLAHGFLTGKYRRDEELPPGARLTLSESARERRLTASNFDLLERLAAFAEERGHTVIELAFAWLLAHSEVSSVIAGASTPQQLEQNAAAAGWTLSDADVSEIEGLMNAAA